MPGTVADEQLSAPEAAALHHHQHPRPPLRVLFTNPKCWVLSALAISTAQPLRRAVFHPLAEGWGKGRSREKVLPGSGPAASGQGNE